MFLKKKKININFFINLFVFNKNKIKIFNNSFFLLNIFNNKILYLYNGMLFKRLVILKFLNFIKPGEFVNNKKLFFFKKKKR